MCLCLGLGLLMLHLWHLFFIFSVIFIVINYITSLTQTHLFFAHVSEYLLLFLDDNVDEESESFWNSRSSASGCCLAFAWVFTNFSLTLRKKVLLKKNVYCVDHRVAQRWFYKHTAELWTLQKRYNFEGIHLVDLPCNWNHEIPLVVHT